MNKVNIFGMYVDDKNLHQFYYKQTKMILNLGGIDIWGNVFDVGTPDDNHILNIDDCQLILKPRSEMSEGNRNKYIPLTTQRVNNDKYPPLPDEIVYYDTIDSFFWLIEHGYALDNKWFENGIAIKESEAGK